MNAYTILTTLRDAILDYAPLSSWCQIHYSAEPRVFVESYQYEPGDETQAPLIVIRRESKRQGWDAGAKELLVGILCKLHDEDELQSTYEDLEQSQGTGRLDEFVEHLEGALAAADLGSNNYIFGFEVLYRPVAELAEWSAAVRLSVREPTCIGQNIFA